MKHPQASLIPQRPIILKGYCLSWSKAQSSQRGSLGRDAPPSPRHHDRYPKEGPTSEAPLPF